MNHIIESKAEPDTNSFEFIFILPILYKRKNIILSDLMSRQKHDKNNPHEVIPLSLNMQEVLHSKHYNIHEIINRNNNYFKTRSQAA